MHLSLAELSLFLAKLAANDLLPAAMRMEMDTHGLGWDNEGATAASHTKGGYFPGSKNGGAELHARITSYANGIQIALVYSGHFESDDPDKLDMDAAYSAAWT